MVDGIAGDVGRHDSDGDPAELGLAYVADGDDGSEGETVLQEEGVFVSCLFVCLVFLRGRGKVWGRLEEQRGEGGWGCLLKLNASPAGGAMIIIVVKIHFTK